MTFDTLSLIQVTGCNCVECRRAAKAGYLHGPYVRSLRLLRLCLDEQQAQQFNQTGEFTVRGSEGRAYKITPARAANLFQRHVRTTYWPARWTRFCAGPYVRDLPVFDHMLAQKLALESDEVEVLRVAVTSGELDGL